MLPSSYTGIAVRRQLIPLLNIELGIRVSALLK
jgi:hypothetical protein